MTYLTESRDALAKALLDSVPPHGGDLDEWWQKFADAPIGSGAVIDASALADDEALVERVARAICRSMDNVLGGTHTVWTDWRSEARAALAALTERSQR